MPNAEKKCKMSGRERILGAFEHRLTDKVPRFDQTVYSNVASAALGRELLVGGGSLRFLEVEARFRGARAAEEFVERMIQDVAFFYQALGYDMARLPWRDARLATAKIDERTYFFGDQTRKGPWSVYRFAPESQNWHEIDSWIAGGQVEKLCAHLEDESRNWRGPDTDPSRFDTLRRFGERVGDGPALAYSIASVGIPMWDPAWLMALEVGPGLVEDELDRQVEQGLDDLELAARMGVDVAHSGLDFCLNTGPVFSPGTFEKLFLPRLQKITRRCDELGIRYVFRTDGVTWPVAGSLFGKSGVHGYGEIDYQAGMRLKELRAKFPRLTLVGNIDCGGALVSGTPAQVRQAVRANLEETGGIGHIFGASNAVMPETPPENYLAMLDEADRFVPGG